MEKVRRRPSVEKVISELNENDFRVRILGNVISLDEENSTCDVDDGTAKAVAFFESSEQLESLETGTLARIIGKVRKNRDDARKPGIDVEIVQDMDMIDLELMKRTSDVIEKLR
jgi:RPA family protein